MLIYPFGWGNSLFGLSMVSLVCAYVLLLLFKRLSNQEKIKFHKNKIVGYILEIRLFRDQFSKTIQNQFRILSHNLIYLRYVVTPFLFMMIPVIIVCIQLENHLGYKPLGKSDSFILRAVLDQRNSDNIGQVLNSISIEASAGVQLETMPIRIVDEGSLYFRAKIIDDDNQQYVTLGIDGKKDIVKKEIRTANLQKGFAPEKCKANSFHYLLCTAENPIPANSRFLSVKINYSKAYYPFFFWEFSPIIYFFILTLIFGFILKPFIKVNI